MVGPTEFRLIRGKTSSGNRKKKLLVLVLRTRKRTVLVLDGSSSIAASRWSDTPNRRCNKFSLLGYLIHLPSRISNADKCVD